MSAIPKSLQPGDEFTVTYRVERPIAYGENRDQSPADVFRSLGSQDPLGLYAFDRVSGVPGYVNAAGTDRALALVSLVAESFRKNLGAREQPHVVIACKHGNPCGAAVGWGDPVAVARKALLGDPLAVMGGEILANFPVTDEVAQALFSVPKELRAQVGRDKWGPDVVIAPAFDEAAVALLGKRESRKLLANPALAAPAMPPDEWMFRPTRGGFMRQRVPHYVFGDDEVEWVSGKELDAEELATTLLAHAAAWRATSNTVVLAKDGMLIGAGVGQQDRAACVRLALDRAQRAGHDIVGSVFASDAFFPFAQRTRMNRPMEGPELLMRAGCDIGVVPADGKRLEEVRELFRSSHMRVAFIPKEHRGFSQH